MPRKPTIATENAAAATRAAKTRTPRVQTVKHSKATAGVTSADCEIIELMTPPITIQPEVSLSAPAPADSRQPLENAREEIAKIAYAYWEERGYQGGSALEDWVRAEEEYAAKIALA